VGASGLDIEKEGNGQDLKQKTEVSLRLNNIENHKCTYIFC
jgi:hypothetical protein